MKFEVTLEDFAGPIDALLSLIEKRKMPISDISLSQIADDYIRFVQTLQEKSLSDTTHFVFVASTLTLVKSKSLLPGLELSDEEEMDICDLKRRIALLQKYQSQGNTLKQHIDLGLKMFRFHSSRKPIRFRPHENIQPQLLQKTLQLLLNEKPQVISKKKEVSMKIAVHIDDIMQSLQDRIQKKLKMNFQNFIQQKSGSSKNEKENKLYQVVGFLAMLELVRNGVMMVLQDDNFSAIEIEKI